MKALAPHAVPEYQLAVRHAKLVIALDALHATHVDCVEGLEVIAKPASKRGVRATRDFAAGDLTLVPLTSSITLKKVGEKIASKQAVVVEHVADVDKERYNAVLMPWVKLPSKEISDASGAGGFGALKRAEKPCVIPFWLVRDVPVARDATVIFKKVTLLDKMKVQVITNPKAIAAGTELVVWQSAPTPEPTTAPAPAAKASAPAAKASAPAPAVTAVARKAPAPAEPRTLKRQRTSP